MPAALRPYLLGILALEGWFVAAHFLLPGARILDLDLEHTLPAWFSALQLAAIGATGFLAFEAERRRRSPDPLRFGWLLVGFGFLYVASDEILALHERALTDAVRAFFPADSLFQGVLPWQLVFAPGILAAFVIVAALLLSRFEAQRGLRRLGIAGLALFALSFVFEGAAKPFFIPRGLYRLEVALEEACEMLGATFLLLAFAGHVVLSFQDEAPVRAVPWRRVLGVAGGIAAAAALGVTLLTLSNPTYLHRRAGDKFLEKGEVARAITAYRTAARREPDQFDLWKRLGGAALRGRDYEAAVEAFGAASRLDPGSASAANDLGVAHFYRGEYDLARAAYERALELRPDFGRAHKNLGVLAQREGDPEAAERAYRRSLEAEPRADVHRYLGDLLADAGREADALVHWQRSLALDPEQRHAPELERKLREAAATRAP